MNNEKAKSKIYFFLVLGSILCPSIVYANPIIMNPVPLVVVPILLPMEGIILARLGKVTRPYFLRFVGVWTLITTVTFILLMTAIITTADSVGAELAGVIGEIAVTLIEGIAVYYLFRSPKFSREPGAAPSLLRGISYSLAANLFSFTGGLLAVEIPARLWGWGVSGT